MKTGRFERIIFPHQTCQTAVETELDVHAVVQDRAKDGGHAWTERLISRFSFRGIHAVTSIVSQREPAHARILNHIQLPS